MEFIVLQKLGLAALLGMIVGWERHLKKNPAGMRTHALVTLGTCAFTVIGLHVLAASSSAIIPIIQAMIIGLGFLGAGLIFEGEERTRGLTTAAEVWTLASVGILVGLGSYFLAIATTLLILVILLPLKWVEQKISQ
ncbi:MAG: MgtC/SapB family protein [bacterium]|nr:MgtC/SapB family protein [bacterium]